MPLTGRLQNCVLGRAYLCSPANLMTQGNAVCVNCCNHFPGGVKSQDARGTSSGTHSTYCRSTFIPRL